MLSQLCESLASFALPENLAAVSPNGLYFACNDFKGNRTLIYEFTGKKLALTKIVTSFRVHQNCWTRHSELVCNSDRTIRILDLSDTGIQVVTQISLYEYVIP